MKVFRVHSKNITGWCSTPTWLLICSSFSREDGHPLLICSSLSTAQIKSGWKLEYLPRKLPKRKLESSFQTSILRVFAVSFREGNSSHTKRGPCPELRSHSSKKIPLLYNPGFLCIILSGLVAQTTLGVSQTNMATTNLNIFSKSNSPTSWNPKSCQTITSSISPQHTSTQNTKVVALNATRNSMVFLVSQCYKLPWKPLKKKPPKTFSPRFRAPNVLSRRPQTTDHCVVWVTRKHTWKGVSSGRFRLNSVSFYIKIMVGEMLGRW